MSRKVCYECRIEGMLQDIQDYVIVQRELMPVMHIRFIKDEVKRHSLELRKIFSLLESITQQHGKRSQACKETKSKADEGQEEQEGCSGLGVSISDKNN